MMPGRTTGERVYVKTEANNLTYTLEHGGGPSQILFK